MSLLDRISQHSILPGLVRRDSSVLDLGGNRGEFSSTAHDRYGWDVTPVEPTPALAEHLRNLGFNVIEAAVTGSVGRTHFTFDTTKELTGSVLGMDIVGSQLDDEEARCVVDVATLSLQALLDLQKKPVDLVKVDIEGAELDMFERSNDTTLLSVRQFTVEFHDYWYPSLKERTEITKRRLTGLGFWMMRAGPNNKDILFVHPDHQPPYFLRVYIQLWLRNYYGFGRMIGVFWQRAKRVTHSNGLKG